jgi:hypothetical protein
MIKIYKTIILPVVLYGRETLSLIPREEHRLRSFGNRVLRRTFGPKGEEVVGRWRRQPNEELRNLYTSLNITRVIKSRNVRQEGHAARMVDMRNAHSILVGKPEGKRKLGKPKRKWEDIIRTDVREIVWEGVEWMHVAQVRDQWRALVNTVMNFGVP